MEITKTEQIFKSNLKYLRESKGISKYKLSSLIGIDFSYYCRLEKPDRSIVPRFKTLEQIANFYKIPVYYLFCAKEIWN